MRKDNVDKRKAQKGQANQSSYLHRLAKLWNPFGRTLVLRGLILKNGMVLREPAEMTQEIASKWAPVFGGSNNIERDNQGFLAEFGTALSLSGPPPGRPQYEYFLANKADSAPGMDGIPFSGWKACGHEGIMTLMACDAEMRTGIPPPSNFNCSLGIFIPKGEEEGDADEILRKSGDLRPLALKGTDNKTICGVWASHLSSAISHAANPAQREFIRGRQLIENIFTLILTFGLHPCGLGRKDPSKLLMRCQRKL